jgi:DNA mismatch repair protein MutS
MEKDEISKLTPMMRQYLEIKKEHQDKVLFFRLGDFYEMFEDDALEVSRLLNLTLTHRAGRPMCGIPYHAAKNYLKRLLDAGKKVAICEQLNLSDNPRELAKREVVQIYTPGTVIDDEYVDSFSPNYILSLSFWKNEVYLAYADMSTGEFYVEEKVKDSKYTAVSSILSGHDVKEVLVNEDIYFTVPELRTVLDLSSVIVTKLPSWYFTVREGLKQIKKQFNTFSVKGFGLEEDDRVLSAVGALFNYIFDMTKSELPQIKNIKKILPSSKLEIDKATERNLELVSPLSSLQGAYTLLSALNRTVTSSGSRLLKESILSPLSDIAMINSRLDWVEYFINNKDEREQVRKLLASTSDLVRISSKFLMSRSVVRDLISVKESLLSLFSLADLNSRYLSLVDEIKNGDELVTLASTIESAINPECTNTNGNTEILLPGFDEELDRLRSYEKESGALLSGYLEKVKAETGLSILKLGENRIIGRYLEVPKGQLDKVPETFIRRQTLVGGERFTTPELAELDGKIQSAGDEARARERVLYSQIVEKVTSLTDSLILVGRLFALLDFYQSGATVASEYGYIRPAIIEEGELRLEKARHPVVEQHLERGAFVPNSFRSANSRFALITGPNMAGKSTFLRQTALIVLMAHMGLFVPAGEAVIPLTDKLFCRVGASDNLAGGESTFLVEMLESSYILRNATRRSLVIMDEIGRGTSTEDGMSLAYAIAQYLLELGGVTLFATHYHELTMLDTTGMQLLTLQVEESKNNITFIRKVIEGVAASSYGLHVARIAGIPQSVIKNATHFQKQHFANYLALDDEPDLFVDTARIEDTEATKLLDRISDFDLDNSSPVDAFMFLKSLRDEIKALAESKKG